MEYSCTISVEIEDYFRKIELLEDSNFNIKVEMIEPDTPVKSICLYTVEYHSRIIETGCDTYPSSEKNGRWLTKKRLVDKYFDDYENCTVAQNHEGGNIFDAGVLEDPALMLSFIRTLLEKRDS